MAYAGGFSAEKTTPLEAAHKSVYTLGCAAAEPQYHLYRILSGRGQSVHSARSGEQ